MNDKTNLIGLGRTAIESQWHALDTDENDAPPLYNEQGLVAENVLEWIVRNIGSLWQIPYSPYPTYSDPETNNGIFKIQKDAAEPVTIALLSDWASFTKESVLIAQQAKVNNSQTNDYTIHLGDTYYVGNQQEIAENFDPQNGGNWPYGTLGSFAMLGNHEMYSSGWAYFTQLLPAMGSYQAGNSDPVQVQMASFFCLENEYWRIIGLDTGYSSLAGVGVTDNLNLELRQEQKDWLQNTVRLNDDNRGIIILSHHQILSAFETEFHKPAEFISSLMEPGRDIIWLVGHEHWFSVYGANLLKNGSKVFTRCIGNGGMPVELDVDGGVKRPKNNNPGSFENRNLVLYDQRQREVIDGNIRLGHNGYSIITLEADKLAINYYDDNDGAGPGRLILEENWTIDNVTGKLTGQSIKDHTIFFGQDLMKQLSWFIGAELTDAIGLPRP